MPTIEERKSQDGTVSYRVKVRLKGFRPVFATFSRKTDARYWARYMGLGNVAVSLHGNDPSPSIRDVLPGASGGASVVKDFRSLLRRRLQPRSPWFTIAI
jgi:hypothetical protein